jgi:hypothetical protein
MATYSFQSMSEYKDILDEFVRLNGRTPNDLDKGVLQQELILRFLVRIDARLKGDL